MAEIDDLLIFAVLAKNLECFKERLALKPNLNHVHPQHGSALMQAVHRDQFEMVKLLLDAGADHRIVGPHGKKAFEYVRSPKMIRQVNQFVMEKHKNVLPKAGTIKITLSQELSLACKKLISEAEIPGNTADIATLKKVESVAKFHGYKLPEWYRGLYLRFGLINLKLLLPDASEMLWCDPDYALSVWGRTENLVKAGLVPIGLCPEGSGDDFFADLKSNKDSTVFRGDHEYYNSDPATITKTMRVTTRSLKELFLKSKLVD